MIKLFIVLSLVFTPKEISTVESACKSKGGVMRSLDHNFEVICIDGSRIRLRKRIA